jgi:hypothetical protein
MDKRDRGTIRFEIERLEHHIDDIEWRFFAGRPDRAISKSAHHRNSKE